jgi:hypothetical protein
VAVATGVSVRVGGIHCVGDGVGVTGGSVPVKVGEGVSGRVRVGVGTWVVGPAFGFRASIEKPMQ